MQNVNYRDSSFTLPETSTLEHYCYLGSPLLTEDLSFNDLACHPKAMFVPPEGSLWGCTTSLGWGGIILGCGFWLLYNTLGGSPPHTNGGILTC